MIIDVTGTVLIPGNGGEDCPGNGKHYNTEGIVECCCEECDYQLCCLGDAVEEECQICNDKACPRAGRE